MYPLKCSDTINSFIWNLLGFEGLNCKNLTHPLKTIVDSFKEMYSDGVYQRERSIGIFLEEDGLWLRDHGSVILEVDCSLHQQLENSTKYLEICSY